MGRPSRLQSVKSQSEKSARGTTPLDDDGASAMTLLNKLKLTAISVSRNISRRRSKSRTGRSSAS